MKREHRGKHLAGLATHELDRRGDDVAADGPRIHARHGLTIECFDGIIHIASPQSDHGRSSARRLGRCQSPRICLHKRPVE